MDYFHKYKKYKKYNELKSKMNGGDIEKRKDVLKITPDYTPGYHFVVNNVFFKIRYTDSQNLNIIEEEAVILKFIKDKQYPSKQSVQNHLQQYVGHGKFNSTDNTPELNNMISKIYNAYPEINFANCYYLASLYIDNDKFISCDKIKDIKVLQKIKNVLIELNNILLKEIGIHHDDLNKHNVYVERNNYENIIIFDFDHGKIIDPNYYKNIDTLFIETKFSTVD